MPGIFLLDIPPVPENATKEDRQRMFDEYKTKMIKMNPGRFNADGSIKSFWQWLKEIFN